MKELEKLVKELKYWKKLYWSDDEDDQYTLEERVFNDDMIPAMEYMASKALEEFKKLKGSDNNEKTN